MNLYELMERYATENKVAPDEESVTPVLGTSLSLFHESLLAMGLPRDEQFGAPHLSGDAGVLNVLHMSYFAVSFLPFNSVYEQKETNQILFDLYSFFRWMDKLKVSHGLEGVDFAQLMRDLSAMQDRCMKLSHLLDEETEVAMKSPPPICRTWSDIFEVAKIEGDFLVLTGADGGETVRLKLSPQTLSEARPFDQLDLVLGDTSEKWILLEAGSAYPNPQGEGK
jgi:hypothetical protein